MCEECGGVLKGDSNISTCESCGMEYLDKDGNIIELKCKTCTGNVKLSYDQTKGTCKYCGNNYLVSDGLVLLNCKDGCGGRLDFEGKCESCGNEYDISKFTDEKNIIR